MSKRWTELADLTEQYENIVRQEENAGSPLMRCVAAR
jgi:hypothetical protein